MFELRDAFPDLRFSLNGGVTSLGQAQQLLSGEWKESVAKGAESIPIGTLEGREVINGSGVHGVMIGRAAMNDPCCLGQADTLIYGGLSKHQYLLASGRPQRSARMHYDPYKQALY